MPVILRGRDENGDLVWVSGTDPDAQALQAEFKEEVRQSPVVKKFEQKYGNVFAADNFDVIGEVLQTLFPGFTELSTPMFVEAVAGTLAGRKRKLVPLESEEPTPPAAPPAPVETPEHRGQALWREYRQFSENHSMDQCRARAREESGFASFMRKNLAREANVPVGDAVENLSARPEPTKNVAPGLRTWIEEYLRTPAEQVRKLKRADYNPTGFAEYNQNLEAAISAGLI